MEKITQYLIQSTVQGSEVRAWEEDIMLPTYEIGKEEKNPIFLEKRVYQGSCGSVYPYPVVEKISDKKADKRYHALFIENEYIKVMILPELGGRIHMAYDKVKKRHFVYYNQVVKPALVGLTGPWISGGIEFNWPQHHRPSTFLPTDFLIEENADGSKTIWCNEVERMFRTKGMQGFTLYPGKAYIEIKVKIYNRTSFPQTFLWWANPAVVVNDHYHSVFPPDVNAVFDHGKRDVSSFPIATGVYYKQDYSAGVDISKYKNIPVPTSYMAIKSKYDFVGGYEEDVRGGLLHVADHHVSPGKKQWTWGNGDFGKAWDRNLTDEDGPYIELMTGMYTDNQPDFTWLQPYEEKSWVQYFMPYSEVGYVKNATKDALLNLEIKEGKARLVLYTTGANSGVRIIVKDFLTEYFRKGIDMIEDTPERFDCVENRNQHITKSSFSGPIQIKVGYNISTGENIYCCFNDSTRYNNQHIAVAGKSGSGKTQFALEFLRQLYKQTQGQVNFLFLDFKGLSEDDKIKMSDFFTETHTECINAPHTPFPLNPVSFIDNVNEKNKLVGINKFVDIIAKYSNIGKKQQQTLKDATKEAFIQHKDGKHPSLKEIYDLVIESVGDNRDTLTEIMERLSEYELFASRVNDPSIFLNNNYYFSLSGELDSTVRFTSIFLIINYIFNVFTNMGGTEVVDGSRSMRYVLMIDEAHDLFREKKSLEILEVLLRKIRSYGVSIILLSQGISEYNQGNFDFSQECETAFLLPINDLNNTKAINKFLGLSEKDGSRTMRNLEKLDNGQCVSNIKELQKGDLFEVVQYWKEKK